MQQEEKSIKQKFLKHLSLFLSRYWKMIIIIPVLIIVIIAGATVYNIRKTNILESSTFLYENVQDEYNAIRAESNEEMDEEKISGILSSLDNIIDKYPSYYAGQRALFLKGDIFFEKKDYAAAIEIYKSFSSKFKNSHLAPIAINNIAVCYEETGDISSSISQYEFIVINYKDMFPALPQTYFSIGRLYEAAENYNKAAENFNYLINNYPDSDWTNLARNRIIYLKAADKI